MAVTGTGTQVLKVTSNHTINGTHVGLSATDQLMLAKLVWGGIGTGGDDIKVSAEILGNTTVIFETKGGQYDTVELSFDEYKCGFNVDNLIVDTLDSGSLYIYLR